MQGPTLVRVMALSMHQQKPNPDSAILTVRIERVEYWDVPASRLVRL
jgi:hypothetical protein